MYESLGAVVPELTVPTGQREHPHAREEMTAGHDPTNSALPPAQHLYAPEPPVVCQNSADSKSEVSSATSFAAGGVSELCHREGIAANLY